MNQRNIAKAAVSIDSTAKSLTPLVRGLIFTPLGLGLLCLSPGLSLTGQNYFPFEIQPVSTASPQLLSQSANGPSFAPRVSADGQWIVFVSQADNLVTNDLASVLTGAYLNLFVYSIADRAVQLASLNQAGTAGGNNHSTSPAISADGRWIAFASDANDLVAKDTNGASDVFVRNRLTGQTMLVSLNRQGTASGNQASSSPAISTDGRYVAFVSSASDLIDGDTNALADVFVRDLVSGFTILASPGASGLSNPRPVGDPILSSDGTRVSFWSTATNRSAGLLIAPDANHRSHILVYDLPSGATLWASAGLRDLFPTNRSLTAYNPVLSADGKCVAFKCRTESSAAIIYRDLASESSILISTNATDYSPVSADSGGPSLSDSGQWLVYLEKGETLDTQVVVLFDRLTGEDTVVSHSATGTTPASGSFLGPVISGDGSTIVYAGQFDQLLPAGSAGSIQVYACDRLTQSNRLVSATSEGQPGAVADTSPPSVSQDGQVMAFCSFDGPMVPGDRNHAQDVFVKSADAAAVQLVSAVLAGRECLTANGLSLLGRDATSEDGRYVVFASAADNLTPHDTNQATDVFVRDLVADSLLLVSANTHNTAPADSWSGDAVISKDGRFVAFVSLADDLVADYTNNSGPAVFVRDLIQRTTVLVSANWTNRNLDGSGISLLPALSADGRWIAFYSEARDLCPTAAGYGTTGKVILFDRLELTNGLANLDAAKRYNPATPHQPRISDDGRFVLFHGKVSNSTNLFAYDRQSSEMLALATNCSFGQGMERFWQSSIAGSWAVYSRYSYSPYVYTNLWRFDLVNKTNYLFPVTGDMPAMSPDTRWLLYVKPFVKHSALTDWQLRLFDRELGRDSLLSAGNESWSSSAVGVDRAAPALSPDAAFAVFRRRDVASVPGDPSRLRRLFIRDIAAEVTFEATEGFNNHLPGRWPCSDFWLSADGHSLLLATPAPDFARGDRNGSSDVYCVRLKTRTNTASGLPDNWCYRYFGTIDISAGDDSDGDGMNNQMEFLAGTDPANADSCLVIANASLTTNGLATLSWPTVFNKSYRVQYRDDLSGANWTDLTPAIIADSSIAQVIDPTPAIVSRFYRILLNP